MLHNLLEKLRDRPILSILLCVVLSEIIQLIITLISRRPPAFHYGIAVMALLALFVIPVILYMFRRKDKAEQDETEETEEAEENKEIESEQ